MSRAKATEVSSPLSLFPFIGVLLSTMGALLVVLICVSRSARDSAMRDAVEQEAADSTEADKHTAEQLAQVNTHMARLEQLRGEAQSQLRDDQRRLSHLEDHMRRLREKMQSLQLAAIDLESLKAQHLNDRAEAEREAQRLERLVGTARETVGSLKDETKNRKRSYAIIPYEGSHGTQRRPIYIECRRDAVLLQPEEIRLTPADFRPPLGAGNPLAVALRAAREYMIRHEGIQGKDMEPYPLILVRPDGILAFYQVREAIESWDSAFGYELIDADWTLEFPPSNPQLAMIVTQAIAQSRSRQQMLVAAAPRAYGSHGAGDSESFDEEAGFGGPGEFGGEDDESGSGWGGGGSGDGEGDEMGGGGQPYGYAARGREGSSASGGSGAGPGGGRGDGTIPGGAAGSATGSPGSNQETYGDSTTGAGSSGPGGNQSGPGGTASSGGAGGSSNGTGATGSGVAGGTANGGTGVGTGTGSGSGTGMASGGSPSGGASAGASGPDGQQSGTSMSIVAGAPVDPMGRPAMPAPPARGGSLQDGVGEAPLAATSRGPQSRYGLKPQPGAAGDDIDDTAEVPPLDKRMNQRARVPARDRGHNWAIQGNAPSAVPIRRPIRVTVSADRFALPPDPMQKVGQQVGREIPLDGPTANSLDDFVNAVHERVQQWDLAGNNMYWRPVLVLDVGPDGQQRAAELARLLKNSGLEIREERAANLTQEGGSDAARRN